MGAFRRQQLKLLGSLTVSLTILAFCAQKQTGRYSLLTSWDVVQCVLTNGQGSGYDGGIMTVATANHIQNTIALYYGAWQGGQSRTGTIAAAFGPAWDSINKHGIVLSKSTSGWDSGYVSGPRLYQESGTNYLFYFGGQGAAFEEFPSRIGVAISTDGTNFTKYAGNPLLNLGSDGSFDDTTLYTFNVVKRENLYYAFYNAYNGSMLESIGFAMATNVLGPWVKYSGNPVVINPGPPNDFNVAADANVFPLDEGGWGMIFRTYVGATTPGKSTLASAFSSDLTNWTAIATMFWQNSIDPGPSELYGTWLFQDNGPMLLADDLSHIYRLRPTFSNLFDLAHPAWLPDGTFQCLFVGATGLNYRVEASTNLLPNSWITLTNFLHATPTRVIRDPSPASQAKRFYRAATP